MNFTIIEKEESVNKTIEVKSDSGTTDLYLVDGEVSRAVFYPLDGTSGISMEFNPKIKAIISALDAYTDYKNSPKSPQ